MTPDPPKENIRLVGMVDAEVLTTPSVEDRDWVETWPHLVFIELIALLLVSAVLWIFSLFVDAPLEQMANPAFTPKVAKAPWYFVGLQELLVYFDPWIAGVLLPGLIIVGLMAIPYLDRDKAHIGEYAPRKRPIAYTVFTFGMVLWFALIAIGTWMRGPNWSWYWPGESWEIAKPAPPTATSLSWPVGMAVLFLYTGGGLWLPGKLWPKFKKRLGAVRYVIVMLLMLGMAAIPLKIIARLVFNIQYVLETTWFNV